MENKPKSFSKKPYREATVICVYPVLVNKCITHMVLSKGNTRKGGSGRNTTIKRSNTGCGKEY
jgi:hypothetical protein